MSEPRPGGDGQTSPEQDDVRRPPAAADWQRRRRLAEVFGDVLPDLTGDERDSGDRAGDGSDDWLKSQVPPHHG